MCDSVGIGKGWAKKPHAAPKNDRANTLRPISVASHFGAVRIRGAETPPQDPLKLLYSEARFYLGPFPNLWRRTSIKTSPSRTHSAISSTIIHCSYTMSCFPPILPLAKGVIAICFRSSVALRSDSAGILSCIARELARSVFNGALSVLSVSRCLSRPLHVREVNTVPPIEMLTDIHRIG